MANLPDCFCPDDVGCDYRLEVTARFYRPGHEDEAVKSAVPWVLENIPQIVAQAIMQASINAVNEVGWDVYEEWLKACVAGDDTVALAARLRPGK